MSGASFGLRQHGIGALRWNGQWLGERLDESALPWARYFPFASHSELSTGPAFKHLCRILRNLLEDHGTGQSNAPPFGQVQVPEIRVLASDILEWLEGWSLEEENHVVFFQTAIAQCGALRSVLNSSEGMSGASEAAEPHYAVVHPIPESQSFSRTLFFLLFSEVASMVWYREWFRRAPRGTLKDALHEIHRDEAMHFLAFFKFAARLCLIDPVSERELRLVKAVVQRSLRPKEKLGEAESSRLSGRGKDFNWWEHPFLSAVSERGSIVGLILRLQSATCERLLRTARSS